TRTDRTGEGPMDRHPWESGQFTLPAHQIPRMRTVLHDAARRRDAAAKTAITDLWVQLRDHSPTVRVSMLRYPYPELTLPWGKTRNGTPVLPAAVVAAIGVYQCADGRRPGPDDYTAAGLGAPGGDATEWVDGDLRLWLDGETVHYWSGDH